MADHPSLLGARGARRILWDVLEEHLDEALGTAENAPLAGLLRALELGEHEGARGRGGGVEPRTWAWIQRASLSRAREVRMVVHPFDTFMTGGT